MEDPSRIFINSWNIYQKVIQANYMKHRDLGIYSQKYLKDFASHQALRVLDIGCGDAKQISRQLLDLNISSYNGYDLSEDAVSLARQNMSKTGVALTFRIGKMEELIKTETATYNVIYSSFAIHHLQEEAKKTFLMDCFQVLEKGGLFILIDVKRGAEQSREEYNKSYVDWINSDWNSLTEEEKKTVAAHLTTCDFPVATSEYIQFAESAGFILVDEVDIDSKHGLIVFRKD
jgi:2-polyprenyl-3-methyl-5-hydroxy-6-metoxy-1,4-benzoquinol methylase